MWEHQAWKKILTYITCQKVHGSASLETSHFVDPTRIREASPVRKIVRPPYLLFIYYKLQTEKKQSKRWGYKRSQFRGG
jgi:hypothetical protein